MAEAKEEERSLTIQVASDLHIEFYGTYDKIPEDIIIPRAPVLALLGDIGLTFTELLRKFIHEQSKRFEHVIVIAGNHEFYNMPKSSVVHDVSQQLSWMRQICKEKENIHFLEQQTIELRGVLICGTTLWSDIPQSKQKKAEFSMNDYRICYAPDYSLVNNNKEGAKRDDEQQLLRPRLLRAGDTVKWYKESIQWLRNEIEQAENKSVLVLTHHTPSMDGTSHPNYSGSELSCCFSSNLADMLNKYPQLVVWACGHTHYNFDIKYKGGARLVSNQRGYPDQVNKDYQPNGVVIKIDPKNTRSGGSTPPTATKRTMMANLFRKK